MAVSDSELEFPLSHSSYSVQLETVNMLLRTHNVHPG